MGTQLRLPKKGTEMTNGMEVGLGAGHIVLDGDPDVPPLERHSPPMSVVAKRLDEDATWYAGRPRPRRLCVRWGQVLAEKMVQSPSKFWPMFIVSKRLDGSRCHLVWR